MTLQSVGPRGRALGRDLLAGATVGLVSLPQAMAFALVAGVPPEVALYTMIVPGLVAGVLRDSPHLASGATNTAALLVGGVLAASPLAKGAGLVPVLSTLCLLVGITKAGVGLAGLGRLSRYVSPAVVRGFTLGAAALLVIGQLPAVLGIRLHASGRALVDLVQLARRLPELEPRAAALGAGTVLGIVLLRRMAPRLPGTLLALVAGAALCRGLGWDGSTGPALLGEIPRGLPHPALPALDPTLLGGLLFPALAIALVGMVEVVSIGKAIEATTGRKLRADRELRAQGFANLASACFPCLPSSVSWGRSAVSVEAGASTPMSVIFASLTVLLAVVAAGPLVRFVPLAGVAGVVLWIAWRLVQPEGPTQVLRLDRSERAVLGVTAASALLLDLELAVFLGVFLSLALVIRRASLLRLSEWQRAEAGHWTERPLDGETGRWPITVLQIEGDLFFGVAEELLERLEAVASRGARAIVIRLRGTHAVDGAAAAALARFALGFRARGGLLLLCGLRPELRASIEGSGLGGVLGEEAIYDQAERPFAALESALQMARAHVGVQPESAALRAVANGADAWVI
jgi:SulP family sulfate permease